MNLFRLFLTLVPIAAVCLGGSTDENLLRNSDFSLGTKFWQLANADNRLKPDSGGVTIAPQERRLMLVQRDLPMRRGVNYRVSFMLESEQGGEYKSYLEWNGGTGVMVNQAFPAGKQQYEYFTNFPADAPGLPYLVLLIDNPHKPVRLSQFRVEACRPRPGAEELGGQWELPAGAEQQGAANGHSTLLLKAVGMDRARLFNVPAVKGRHYRFRFTVCGVGEAGTTTGYFPFRVKLTGVEPDYVDDTMNVADQHKELVFDAPSDRLEFSFSSGRGTIRFGNFRLEEFTEPLESACKIVLTSPAYRNTIYESIPAGKQITGSVTAPKAISAVTMKLTGADGRMVAEQQLQRDNGWNFSFPTGKLTIGDYRLTAECRAAGNLIRIEESLHRIPRGVHEVVVGRDLNLYVDGKLFLPIGFFELPARTPEVKKALAAHGVNFCFINANTAEQALKELDAAHAAGLMCVLSNFTFNPPRTTEKEEFAAWQHKLRALLSPEVLRHPALLGHFLADEPGWTGSLAPALEAGYRYYCELDPYHPVWINAAPRGTVGSHRNYSRAADIYGLDIYPVPVPNSHSGLADKNLTCIGEYTRMMRQAVEDRKPVWMTLQGFCWNDYQKSKPATKGYPTLDQSRFAAFQAFANGAKSISWWGAEWALSVQFLEELLQVNRELYDLSGLLAAGTWTRLSIDSGVERYHLQCPGKEYSVLMNSNPRPVEVAAGPAGELVTLPAYGVKIIGSTPYPVAVNPPPPSWQGALPFAELLRKRLNRQYFKSSADWIWDAGLKSTAGSKVWFRRDFTIAGSVKKAELLITADDCGKVWLDGQPLGDTGRIQNMKRIEFPASLKPGRHQLLVYAEDLGGLPCGLLAQLNITYADGRDETIWSDAQWRAIPAKDVKTMPDADASWSPAAIVCRYGEGAWSSLVYLP